MYYPAQKRDHPLDSRREECCSTCDIMLDQGRSAHGKSRRQSRIGLAMPWSSMISHVDRAGKIRSPSRHLRPKKYFWRPDHRPRWSIWRLSFRPRVQFCDPSFALGSMCKQTVLYGDRKTNDRFPKTKFKISKTFLVIRVTLTWHTLTRPSAPSPPPPLSNTVVPCFFFW